MSIIKKAFNQMFIIVTGKNLYYHSVIVKKFLEKISNEKNNNKFLFILSPPYCGSTLLNEIVSTSKNVSGNNLEGTREGQQLPVVRDMMFNHDRKWDESYDFNWALIKNEWMKYWDLSAPVLLEKSPPNIIRAQSINKHFNPSYFIIFYRNPYAHVESLMRRKNWTPQKAAEFSVRCLKFQKTNIESFRNALPLSYEEVTKNPHKAKELIVKFLPELSDICVDKEFNGHNFNNEKLTIRDLNKEKINRLTASDLEVVNSIFKEKHQVLSFFNYELITL